MALSALGDQQRRNLGANGLGNAASLPYNSPRVSMSHSDQLTKRLEDPETCVNSRFYRLDIQPKRMMNASWSRILKSVYRREPITSFAVTIGAVDAVIGGVGASGSLLVFGLGTAGVAIALRWWQLQRASVEQPAPAPEYYLPPHSSRPQIPMLSISKKNPPY